MVSTTVNECKYEDHNSIIQCEEVTTNKHYKLYFFQLFKPKEDKDDSTKIIYQPPKSLLVACQQIVDCLIEHLLQLEETNTDGKNIITFN